MASPSLYSIVLLFVEGKGGRRVLEADMHGDDALQLSQLCAFEILPCPPINFVQPTPPSPPLLLCSLCFRETSATHWKVVFALSYTTCVFLEGKAYH